MNNLKLVPFKIQHLDLMDIREHELLGAFTLKNMRQRLENIEKTCMALTILYDGRVLGVMGSIEFWPGVCEVWVIPSTHIKEYSLIFARVIKKNLKNLEDVYGYHRIQVTALHDELHNRWLSYLGFKCEGILKKFSMKKQDFSIWARLNNGT